MQVTQIFFDWIDADGRKWAAVIGHEAGGRTFHSLRGAGRAGGRERQGRGMLDAWQADVNGSAIPSPSGMGASIFQEAVICAENADRR